MWYVNGPAPPSPQQAQMQQQLAKSLDDLRGGLDAARRMVRERCQIGEDG